MKAERIKKPRGTSDFIGEDKALFDSIVEKLFLAADKFGCQKIDVPIFEEQQLFFRGVGESSDIVSKEMFKLDVKGEHNYIMRPEFTASVNRSVIENKLFASPDLPIKLSYCGPVFRYERPQAGRLRQFHQFGIEFFDSKIDTMTAMDSVLLLYRAAEEILGHELYLKVNYLGGSQARENYRKALREYYRTKVDSMCEDCHRRYQINVLRMLDCKVPEDIEINKGAPAISGYLIEEDKKNFETMLNALDALKIEYKRDDRLVRGLDYYTGLVFEIYDPLNRKLGAIGAGGQYGKLMEELGGPEMEGIGFSFGIERLMLALDSKQKEQLVNQQSLDYFIVDLRAEKDALGIILADILRSAGRSVSASSYSKKINGSLKMADRLKAKTTLIFTDNNPGVVLIKNMETREQIEYPSSDVDKIVSKLMEMERE
ncbi:MAG: histidine--tRNA ligase [Bacilli bacterium]